jgi:riboflavin kinase/FMN adenylyltransferase
VLPVASPRVFHDARGLPAEGAGRVVVIGNFDGVHRGHREVVARAAGDAARRGESVAVLTFEPHPASVLGRGAPPQRLTRLSRKVELLGACGVSLVVAQRFDAAFAALAPAEFVDEILVRGLGARLVVVGHDFRFGAKRAGDLETLRALGRERGFDVDVQDVVGDARGAYSSSRVRAALAVGDLDEARQVLGRPHAIEGGVITGDRRGRTLGFPTANLAHVVEALPANGVYAVAVDAAHGEGPEFDALAVGVANVGIRPTLGGDPAPRVEAHLFDLAERDRDLYGRALRVHWLARLREERRFAGLEELKAQIAADAAQARAATADLARPDHGGWF